MSRDLVRLKFKTHFDAAHWLRDYVGKCANTHGHRWHVIVTIAGEKESLSKAGLLIDFKKLKDIVKDLLPDHECLNHIKPFSPNHGNINPTAENISMVFFNVIKDRLMGFDVELEEVEIFESENASAIYRGGK